MFDEKVKDFMEKHKDQTMLGFAWSLYWRLYVVIILVSIGIGILAALFE